MKQAKQYLQQLWETRLKPKKARLISKYFYGNTVEHYANVEGRKNWQKAKTFFVRSGDPQSRHHFDLGLHRQYSQKGYAVLGSVDLDVLHVVQQSYLEAIQNPDLSKDTFADPRVLEAYNHGNYQGTLEEYRRHIVEPEVTISNYVELLSDALVYRIQSCFGSYFKTDGLVAWRNSHCPSELLRDFEPHANRWHFDDQYADRAKLFIYLSDVTEEHGPFQNLERDYSRYLLLRGFKKEARKYSATGGLPQKLFSSSKVRKHTGPAGTVIMCATSFCLHRGGELAPGNSRDVIEFSLRPSTVLEKALLV